MSETQRKPEVPASPRGEAPSASVPHTRPRGAGDAGRRGHGDRPAVGKTGDAAAAAAKSLQSCPTPCDPIDGSPSGSTIPGILQARTLERVAISFSRGSSQSRDRTLVSCGEHSLRQRSRSAQEEIGPWGAGRRLVELCVEPAGLCGRCTGVAVPLRVVPSPTGLPSHKSRNRGQWNKTQS